MLAKEELPLERWHELLSLIDRLCHSQDSNERLVRTCCMLYVNGNENGIFLCGVTMPVRPRGYVFMNLCYLLFNRQEYSCSALYWIAQVNM